MNAFTKLFIATAILSTLITSASAEPLTLQKAHKSYITFSELPSHREVAENDTLALAEMLQQELQGAVAEKQQCNMITIVSPKGGWNRDLKIKSTSILAAGAIVEVPTIDDEAGFVIGIIGDDAGRIQLLEEGWFGDRTLVSGWGYPEFKGKAEKKGYIVLPVIKIGCQINMTSSLLTRIVKRHKKTLSLITEIASL